MPNRGQRRRVQRAALTPSTPAPSRARRGAVSLARQALAFSRARRAGLDVSPTTLTEAAARELARLRPEEQVELLAITANVAGTYALRLQDHAGDAAVLDLLDSLADPAAALLRAREAGEA